MNGDGWKRLVGAITKLHGTGLAPETRPEALEAVADCLDARKAVLFEADLGTGAVSGLRTHNIDPDATGQFAAYYHRLDPWLQSFDSAWQARQPIRGTRIVPDSTLRRTEYYNDFIKPLDMRFALTGFPVKTARWMNVLTVFRGVKQLDFDDESLWVYQYLLEHAAQAMEVQRTVGNLQARFTGLAAALEQASQPVILLGRAGRVLYANPAAERLLAAGDGLGVRDQRLDAASPEARKALDHALQQATNGAGNGARSGRRVVVIPRRSGRRAYVVRVAPVARAEDMLDLNELDEFPRWLLRIADPEVERPRPASCGTHTDSRGRRRAWLPS